MHRMWVLEKKKHQGKCQDFKQRLEKNKIDIYRNED